MPRSALKVTVVVGGGGGVESKFSVQLRPKLNKTSKTTTRQAGAELCQAQY